MNLFLTRKLKKIGKRAEPSRDFDALLRHKLADAGYAPFARPSFAPLWKTAGALFGIVAMTFSGTGVYAYASDDVLPGDTLYKVRQQIESIEESVAVAPEKREAVQWKHLQRRVKEAKLMLARNKPMPPVQAAVVVQQLAEVVKQDEQESPSNGATDIDQDADQEADGPSDKEEADHAREMIKEDRAEMADLLEMSNEEEEDAPLKPMIQRKMLERMAGMQEQLRKLEQRRLKVLGSRHVEPLEYAPSEARGVQTD